MIELVNSLSLIFIVAAVLLFVFHKFGHPHIPAYIIAGIAVSPFVSEAGIIPLAEIGIAFLVFIFGSSLKLEETERAMESTAILTISQVAIIGCLVFLYSYIVGFGPLNSVYLAVAASLSSSLVGMELIEGRTIKLAYKRLCNSINLTQDLIAILVFLVLASFPLTQAGVLSNIQIGGSILLLGFLARFLVPYLLEFVKRSSEASMLIALTLLLSFASISQYFGISIVIGSFAAGIALSKPPYDQEVIETFEPLKDFFSALFFVSLGALVMIPNIPILLASIGLVIVITVVKPVFTVLLLESQGYSRGTSLMTALNLDQMSEFALILAIHGYVAGMIMPTVFQAIVLSAVASMVISSYTSRHVWDIYDRVKDYRLFNLSNLEFVESKLPEDLSNHFIVAGYDVQGKEIAHFLRKEGKQVLVIDNDPERVLEAREKDMNYIYGDLMIQETWKEADFKDAEMIISTVPLENITRKIIDLDTDAYKIVRTQYLEEAREYIEDVLYVVVPRYLSSNRLIEHLEGCLESDEYREKLRRISRRELS